MAGTKQVRIAYATYSAVIKYGEYGDTFDDIIKKILRQLETGKRNG